MDFLLIWEKIWTTYLDAFWDDDLDFIPFPVTLNYNSQCKTDPKYSVKYQLLKSFFYNIILCCFLVKYCIMMLPYICWGFKHLPLSLGWATKPKSWRKNPWCLMTTQSGRYLLSILDYLLKLNCLLNVSMGKCAWVIINL